MDEFIRDNEPIIDECRGIIQNQKLQTTCADSADSAALRKKANELYKSKSDLDEALKLYTLSARAAEVDSEDLALALGNRSAVTFELKQYKLCVRDITSAMSLSSIPEALVKRLLLRKAKCMYFLRDLSSFTQVYERALDGTVDLTTSERKSLEEMKNKLLASTNVTSTEGESVEVYKHPSSSLPAASEAVVMKLSATRGRYLQARQDLPAGCVLISEEPYVTVLLPDHWISHCYHCLTDLYSIPIFCRRSDCLVRYCTVHCQQQSYDSYHKYECTHLDTIVNTGIGHLAYRVIAFTGYKQLLAHRERTPADSCHKSYDAVYNLVTNSQHVLAADHFQYSKTALLLLICLMKSHFFPPSVTSLHHTDVVYVASLLLRHIQQLICNAHAITVVGETNSEVGGAEGHVISQSQNKLASAIYPTASLMNHSCKPNIIASFVGSTLVVKNSEDLGKGDEVYNCYGPHYQKMERSERQRSLLTQYYFSCDCQPCTEQSSHVSSLKALCCVNCKGRALLVSESQAKCEQCGGVYNASWQIEQLMQARQLLNEAKNMSHEAGLERTCKARDILSDGVVHKYSIELANACDMEAQIAAASGDMTRCARCLLSSVDIIERLYPEYSIERAHEYHKISEVLCNTRQYSRALHYANKAKAIFNRQYSRSHDLVKELELLCRQIQMVSA